MIASTIDLGTRLFWRATGRPIDLSGSEAWLDGPIKAGSVVGDAWLSRYAERLGLAQRENDGAGLLQRFSALTGPSFNTDDVAPQVAQFYESTALWDLDVWSQWSPLFQPAGSLVSTFFARRVKQLALPVRPLEVAKGMTSRVVPLVDDSGEQQCAAWIRTLTSNGETVFSGCYALAQLPRREQPVIHVSFPLESGNLQVFLEPRALPDGSFVLSSSSGRFGDPGAYVVVDFSGQHFAARIPLHEHFHVYEDAEGQLRTDHTLKLGPAKVMQLHYRLGRRDKQ